MDSLFSMNRIFYRLCSLVEETDRLFLPLRLRPFNTLRPSAVLIRSLNPCLFLLFLLEGWNVLFGMTYLFSINGVQI